MASTISRPTITDDSGAGTNGTVLDAAWLSDFEDRLDAIFGGATTFALGGALALGRYTTTSTGTQNNWDIDAANSGTTVGVLRCNNGSELTINGIVAPSTHRLLLVVAVNSTVTFAHEAAGSTAANRVTTQGANNISITSGGSALLAYDVTSARWKFLSFGVVPNGSTSNYLRGDGTWATVASGAVGTSTITTTGTQTALALPSGSGPLVIFANNATLLTLQGIAAGTDGQELTIYSIGAGQVDLPHQNSSASAANRLVNIATSYKTSLSAGSGSATYKYDATAARWRLRSHDQGAPIDYSGTSTIVGFSSYTTKHLRYLLCGRNLRFFFAFNGTSNSTTTSFTLPFTATAAAADGSADFVNSFTRDNGVTISAPTRSQFADSVTVQSFIDMGTTAWTAANQKIIRGTSEVDID